MADLIVVGFKNNKFKAADVLNQLRRMDEDWTVNLYDAVAVHRDDHGKLRIDQSYGGLNIVDYFPDLAVVRLINGGVNGLAGGKD